MQGCVADAEFFAKLLSADGFVGAAEVFGDADDVLQIIDFALKMSARQGSLLVCCQSGISRSTATALTVCAALLGRGKEREAWALVLAARPQARPNRWIVELADRALGRNGKLAAAIEFTATRELALCQQLTPRNRVSFGKS